MLRKLGAAGGLAVVASVTIVTLARVRTFRDDVEWRAHTHVAIELIDSAKGHLLAADSFRRAYRLGRDANDLHELEARVTAGRHALDALVDTTADNPTQQARLVALGPFLDERLRILRTGLTAPNIDEMPSAGREAYRAVQRRGSELARLTDGQLEVMRATEESLLSQREARASASARGLEETIAFGSLPAIGWIAALFFLLTRERTKLLAANVRLVDQHEELVVLTEALAEQASRDALTGLLNRRSLDEVLTRELTRVLRRASSLVVLMIDVDHFKVINDRYGHSHGDEVLREVARRLQGAVRPLDAVGRYGGEEFLVIMPDCENVFAAADRVRKTIAKDPIGPIEVTVSIGVTTAMAEDGPGSLVARADVALYVAKQRGRNRVSVG